MDCECRVLLFSVPRTPLLPFAQHLRSARTHPRLQRATASVLERTLRSKGSVITEATVTAKQVIAHNLRPHHEHFFPARKVKGSLANASAYGTIATTIVPKKWQVCVVLGLRVERRICMQVVLTTSLQIIEEGKMDMWDFIVRNMFTRKASTVDKALP